MATVATEKPRVCEEEPKYTNLNMNVCMYVCIYNQEQSTHGVAITAPSLGQVRDMQETSTLRTILDKYHKHTA